MQAAHFPFHDLQCGVASAWHLWARCKHRCLLTSSQVKMGEEGWSVPQRMSSSLHLLHYILAAATLGVLRSTALGKLITGKCRDWSL